MGNYHEGGDRMLKHSPVVTHIAGESFVIDDRYMRYRCPWCGEKISDLWEIAIDREFVLFE